MNLRKEAQVLVKYIRNDELKIGEIYDDWKNYTSVLFIFKFY